MKFVSMLAVAGAIAPAIARPANQPRETCTNPEKRAEWRQLSPADQQSYIKAVLCLKTKPSKMGLKTPLYDDFPNVHFKLNQYIHGSAPFLPWHRYFVHVYNKNLRECGYEGPGTYWDWTQDTAGLRLSAVMSAETGFGGNGNPAKTEKHPDGGADLKCVTEGPFAGLRPEYLAVTPKTMAEGGHCMFRDLPEVSEPAAFDQMKGSISPEYIAELQAYQNFTTYHTALEGGPHGVIHASLGGEMNPTTSPNDPLFFLHHGMVDFLWWQWQEKNSARLTDYNGVASHVGEDKAREVALDDILAMNGIEKDVTVRDVMDTRGSLCYTY
ncbi:Di-copper centre-containing protein [Apiospora arundinis]|uniref:Monophenol monooxygenase (Tyrosinase) n=1 Tax=Apiospora arundinis TaxID=335852 RepID=A0ABR2JHH4_9PEZI